MRRRKASETHLLNLALGGDLSGGINAVVDRMPRREVAEVVEDVKLM